jgi:hypothetical protein
VVALQFEMYPGKPVSAASAGLPASSTQPLNSSHKEISSPLAEELETTARRVRKRLTNMTTDAIEIGRELEAVKLRLHHGQFLNWVETACELSPRTAQLMMRASEWAEGKHEIVSHLEPTAIYLLTAPSTPDAVRQEVLSRLEEGKRPAPNVVKQMIQAARQKRPGRRSKNNQVDRQVERLAQTDRTESEGASRQEPRLEYAETELEQPETARQNADDEQADPPRPEAPLRETARLLVQQKGGDRSIPRSIHSKRTILRG